MGHLILFTIVKTTTSRREKYIALEQKRENSNIFFEIFNHEAVSNIINNL